MRRFKPVDILILMAFFLAVALMGCGSETTPFKKNNIADDEPVPGTTNTVTPLSQAERLSADTYAGHTGVQVAHADNGDMLAVWSTTNALERKLLYSLYNSSTAQWSAEQPVGTGTYMYSLTTNGTEFLLVFPDFIFASDTYEYGIYEMRFNGSEWSPKTMACLSCSTYNVVRAVSNGTSYAFTFDGRVDGTQGLHAVIYNGTGWNTPDNLQSYGGSATSPIITSNGTGYAVLWSQYDTSSYSSPTSLTVNIYNGTGWEGQYAVESSST